MKRANDCYSLATSSTTRPYPKFFLEKVLDTEWRTYGDPARQERAGHFSSGPDTTRYTLDEINRSATHLVTAADTRQNFASTADVTIRQFFEWNTPLPRRVNVNVISVAPLSGPGFLSSNFILISARCLCPCRVAFKFTKFPSA